MCSLTENVFDGSRGVDDAAGKGATARQGGGGGHRSGLETEEESMGAGEGHLRPREHVFGVWSVCNLC